MGQGEEGKDQREPVEGEGRGMERRWKGGRRGREGGEREAVKFQQFLIVVQAALPPLPFYF